MNEMQVFSSEQFGEIRTIERNGEVWFVATDVCRALELGNPSETVKRLDKDELTSVQLRSDTQKREMNIINEPGLYSLILGSRKPEAGIQKVGNARGVAQHSQNGGVHRKQRRADQHDPERASADQPTGASDRSA